MREPLNDRVKERFVSLDLGFVDCSWVVVSQM